MPLESGPIDPAELPILLTRLAFAVGATKTGKDGKKAPDLDRATITMYYEAVADVPTLIVRRAVEMLISSVTYRGFLPTIGALREACATAGLGVRYTPGEAWEIIRPVLRRISNYAPDQSNALIATVPSDVSAVVRRIGWYVIKDMPSDEARRTFCREWERTVEQQRQRLLLPGLWPSALTLPAQVSPQLKALPGA